MRPLLNRFLLALAAGHFVVDVNANLLPVMLPILRTSLGLSYAQAGLIMACYSTTSSMAQPIFGYLSDRIGGRMLLVLPIAWMVIFMGAAGSAPALVASVGMTGTAPAYVLLVALVTLAGLGSAAYHPQAAANARRVGGRRVATAVSIFSLGGIAGYSIGPMVGVAVFDVLGIQGTAAFVPVGLLVALGVGLALSGLQRPAPAPSSQPRSPERFATPMLTLGSLLLVVIMRAWVEYGVVAYTPLRFPDAQMYSSQVLFAFLFGEALGTFVGAVAADHLGRRRIIVGTSLLLAPALYLYTVTAGGPVLFATAAVAGLLLGSSVPVTIVMAQELLPRNVGVASGLMMGFAFGMGGIGVAINGVIADHYGLASSLSLLAVLPLIGSLIAATFPASMEAHPTPETELTGAAG